MKLKYVGSRSGLLCDSPFSDEGRVLKQLTIKELGLDKADSPFSDEGRGLKPKRVNRI